MTNEDQPLGIPAKEERDVDKAWKALSRVIDPEVGLNIVSMGLVYTVEMWENDVIQVEMTLTTRACPMGAHIQGAAEGVLHECFPNHKIDIQLVWDPPWSPAMISPEGLAELRG